jgi:hypothetical protein
MKAPKIKWIPTKLSKNDKKYLESMKKGRELLNNHPMGIPPHSFGSK